MVAATIEILPSVADGPEHFRPGFAAGGAAANPRQLRGSSNHCAHTVSGHNVRGRGGKRNMDPQKKAAQKSKQHKNCQNRKITENRGMCGCVAPQHIHQAGTGAGREGEAPGAAPPAGAGSAAGRSRAASAVTARKAANRAAGDGRAAHRSSSSVAPLRRRGAAWGPPVAGGGSAVGGPSPHGSRGSGIRRPADTSRDDAIARLHLCSVRSVFPISCVSQTM